MELKIHPIAQENHLPNLSSCSFSRVYWVYTHFRSIWIVASLTALLYLDSLEDFDARSSRLRLLPTSFSLQNNQQKQPKILLLSLTWNVWHDMTKICLFCRFVKEGFWNFHIFKDATGNLSQRSWTSIGRAPGAASEATSIFSAF